MVFGINNAIKLQNDVFCLTEERDFFQAKFLEQVSEITALKKELERSKKEIGKLRKELMSNSMGGASSSIASPRRSEYSHSHADSPISGSVTATATATATAAMGVAAARGLQRSQHHQEEKKEGDDDEDDEDQHHNDLRKKKNAIRRQQLLEGEQFPSHHHYDDEVTSQVTHGSIVSNDDEDDDDHDADSAKDIRQSAEKLLQWATYRSSMHNARTLTAIDIEVPHVENDEQGDAHSELGDDFENHSDEEE